jgi:hypothetical protein
MINRRPCQLSAIGRPAKVELEMHSTLLLIMIMSPKTDRVVVSYIQLQWRIVC